MLRPFVRTLLQDATRIIITHPHAQGLPDILRAFKEKLVVIPLGVDLDWLEPTREVPQKASWFRTLFGPRIVLYVGRLVYYKGLEHLLAGMLRVDGHLVIVGSGPLVRRLRR